jgi:pimeloyl-ACP methyl ester carboxylesterase
MTASSMRVSSRPFRFLSIASVLLAFAGASSGCAVSSEPTPAADPVSPRVVEVVEYGAGDTTVVFESGLGNDWMSWAPVATEVAAGARMFAYSRPGYGQSEPTPEPRDAAHIVEDLRVLLVARGFAPPYVLVGHSFGGAYMELFAKAHPEEVMGVVLVEPRHRDFTTACEQAGLAGCTIPASVLTSLPRVQIDEIEAFARTSDQIRAVGTFGAYPVRVLTATSHGFEPEVELLWESMLGSLAAEATDGVQSLFVGAGHLLQLERSHEVAQVILSLLPTRPGKALDGAVEATRR